MERGDDVSEHVGSADAVVVLDAATPSGTDYRLAMEAVAQALERTDVRRIVSVTVLPNGQKERAAFRDRAEDVERELTRAGYAVTAIRVGLLVGSPDQPAPADAALFGEGKRPMFPGTGDQEVRPLLITDLAAIVASALSLPRPPTAVEAEGPETLTMRGLLRKLNPGKEPRRQHSKNWQFVAFFLALLLPLFVFIRPVSPWLGDFIWLPVVVAVAVSVSLLNMSSLRANQLPADKFDFKDEAAPKSCLGLPLTPLSRVWTAQALTEREKRRKRRRALRKYSSTTGAFLAALLLLAFSLAAFGFGVHDAALPDSGLGSRVAGLTLASAGCLTALGVIAVFRRWPSRYALGFSGSLVFAAVLATILVSALLSGDPPFWTLFVGSYLTAAAISCCIVFWKRGGLVVANLAATRGQKVLGSVIVGGTIITLGQALYSSVYVPTTVTPSVSGDVEIMAAGNGAPTARINRDTRVPLVARVKLSNPSNHAITVLGARYVVRALKLTPTIPKERLQATAANREREYSRIKQSTVVELGNLLTPGTSLEGGEEMTRGLIVLAPADFTTAILRVDLALARPRYKRERGLTWTVPANGVLNSVAQIEDTSWLHLLTRSPRYIHFLEATGGQLGCQPPVEVVAYVDNDQRTTRKRWCRQPTRIDEHYGVTTEQISAETRLTQ